MSIGAQLRTAREAKGLSIATLAQRTRVQARTLAAIELNDLSLLPPRPFGRGFVRAFAQEVDLDPDRTVRDYFAQFPPMRDPNGGAAAPDAPIETTRRREMSAFQVPSHWTWLGTGVAILLLVVAAAVVAGRRGENARDANAVGTSGSSPAAPAKAEAQAPAPSPASSQESAASPAPRTAPAATPAAPLSLAFSVSRPCWVTAKADGQRTIYRILQAGDRDAVNAEREIAIRFGDAGAVTWTINGRQGESLGASGAVRDLRITAENAATVR
jgi:cytoskeleton protein RodZ